MGRPKRGEKGSEEATNKWRQTMLNKYGKEGLHRKMQEMGRKGGLNGRGPGYTGGFAGDRNLAIRAGHLGGLVSRRTGVKNGEGKNAVKDIERAEKILETEDGRA